jgi:hypothetical protein
MGVGSKRPNLQRTLPEAIRSTEKSGRSVI